MLKKGTKLFSILKMRCPKCNKGRFYESHPYNLKKIGEVKKECNNCNLKYDMEPGFFQGSYYVSYGLGVALFVAIFVLKMLILPDLAYLSTLILMVVVLLILAPLLFALSKIIWINLFVSFDNTYF
ncbi:DUF983 domain-containing protein [uncultured Polaribacter sp.]|jgi:uncharacterized protein (DUF983 family)|uniref:DUF983 domain-containing protein n=1 Tax=uncultured Polaribacter sp. TaxID=174711 RepID=UPI0030DDA449